MANTIDNLSIGISVDATSATKSINSLAKSLQRLGTVSNTRITPQLDKIGKSMVNIANGSNAIKTSSFTRFINNINRLSSIKSVNTTNIMQIGNAISSVSNSLATASGLPSGVNGFINALARLSNAGTKASSVAVALPTLGSRLSAVITAFRGIGGIDSSVIRFTSALGQLASAGTKTQTTIKHLSNLGTAIKKVMTDLQSAPSVSENTIRFTSALGQLASAGSRAGSSVNSMLGNMNNLTRSTSGGFSTLISKIKQYIPFANKGSKATKGFASSIGMFYAKFFLVLRAIQGMGRAIGSAQDYIEEFNYFNVALTKVGRDSKEQWRENGYDSAEEYANSFKTRFKKLQKQMTGYDVDTNTGELSSGLRHNLGLNITDTMRYQGAISQITNSAGMLGEVSINSAKALSMLASDWSSLSNQDLTSVQSNLQSAIVGQSRSVYKFGIDITQAGLQQTAYNNGIKASVANMSQQAKMQLRVLTMLKQSKVAWGDLGRTINQPANQLRMLEQNWKQLCMMVGNLFIPLVQRLYPYMNALVMVVKEFVQWIARALNLSIKDTAVTLPDYEDATDGMDDYANATDKASKSAKKLSDNIQGFDVLNKLDDNSDSSTSTGTPDTLEDIDLSDAIAKALANYEKVWNNAFKSNQNKAVQFAKKIKKALLDGWRKGGDYKDLGVAFARYITRGLKAVPWTSIKSVTGRLGSSLATLLNGTIEGTDWNTLGETIAEVLNSAIEFGYIAVSKFNFKKFGTSLATGIDSFIRKIDINKLGTTLGKRVRGIIDLGFSFIQTLNLKNTFATLGKKIASGINAWIYQMNMVDESGMSGWGKLASGISDGIAGIATTISTALDKVNWGEVGQAISDFLTNIKWGKILVSVGKAIVSALMAIIRTTVLSFKNDPIGVGKSLVIIFGSIFAYKKLKGALVVFKTLFSSLLKNGLAGVNFSKLSSSLTSSLSDMASSVKSSPKLKSAFGGIGKAMGYWAAIYVTSSLTTEVGNKLTEYGKEIQKQEGYKSGAKTGIGYVLEVYGGILSEKGKLIKNVITLDGEGLKEQFSEIADEYKGTTSGGDIDLEKSIKNTGEYADVLTRLSKAMKKLGYSDSKQLTVLGYVFKQLKNGTITVKSLNKAIKNADKYSTVLTKLSNAMRKAGYSDSKQLQVLGDVFKKLQNGTVTIKTLNKTIDKVDFSNYTNDLNKLTNALGNTNTAKDFIKTQSAIHKKLQDLGIDFGTSYEATKSLKKMVENGTISWKQYKAIVDGSYTSVKNLHTEVSKIAGKKVADILVTYPEDSKKNVKDAKNDIKSIPNKKNTKVEVDYNKLKNVSLKLKVKAEPTAVKSAYKAVQEVFTKSPIGLKFSSYDPLKLIKKMNAINNDPLIAKQAYLSGTTLMIPKGSNEKLDALVKFAEKNKITYKRYANGGFPSEGQLFLARESGPELVGSMNGKTAVANNNQITDGISNAVAPAVYMATKQALKEVLPELNTSNDVYLDGQKITTSVMNNAKKISKSRGTSWALA